MVCRDKNTIKIIIIKINPRKLYVNVCLDLSMGQVGSVEGLNQTQLGWIELLNFEPIFDRIFGSGSMFWVIG